MLKLLGFSASNYYNVAKLALLEKGIEFEEVTTWTGSSPDFQPEYFERSPMGKVPCLLTDDGPITESRCIVDYLEGAYPEKPLYPADPFLRARVLEMTTFIDLYLELPVRRLLPFMFTGQAPPKALATEVRTVTGKAVAALKQRASFDAFLCGDTFTAADVAGILHFPQVSGISGMSLGGDVLQDVPGLSDYMARMEERDTVKKVRADAKKNMPVFLAQLKSRA